MAGNAVALRNLGHMAVHVRDLGYRHAEDYEHLISMAWGERPLTN